MQNEKLHNLSNIISGYSLRTAVSYNQAGQYKVVQAKDLKPNEIYLDTNALTTTDLNISSDNQFLQKNDILLISRGMSNFSAVLYDKNENNIIATSSFYIIRLIFRKILPEYLLTFLNSNSGQKSLNQIASGSTIKHLSISELKNIDIPIPTLAQQNNIIALNKNIKSQIKLNYKKIKLKKEILNVTINNLIRKETNA